MSSYYTLNNLKPGERAIVKALNSAGSMRRRLLDIGLIQNTEVECIGRSPCGDPKAFMIRGAVIAIRSEDCSDIVVNNLMLPAGNFETGNCRLI